MEKLKKARVKIHICPTCKGNGYLKVGTEFGDTVHQCWDCDSEGEFYVYESEISDYDNVDNSDRNTNKLLH